MKVKEFIEKYNNVEVYAYDGYSTVFEDNLELIAGNGLVTESTLQEIEEVEVDEYYICSYDEYMNIFPSCKEHVEKHEYDDICVVLISEDWRQNVSELPYTLTSKKDVQRIVNRGGSAKAVLEEELVKWLNSLTGLSEAAKNAIETSDPLIEVFGLCESKADVEEIAAEIYSDED